jgi:hypothetical protein
MRRPCRSTPSRKNWGCEIWRSQEERGFTASTLTPELGSPPYMHTLPHTNVPVADLAAVCDWMATRQRDRFAAR